MSAIYNVAMDTCKSFPWLNTKPRLRVSNMRILSLDGGCWVMWYEGFADWEPYCVTCLESGMLKTSLYISLK